MKNTFFLLLLVAASFTLPAQVNAQGPTDKQFQAIEKLMAPERKKLTDVLETDKTGQYKIYQTDIENAAREKDPARQAELIAKLERDHLAFIRKAYAKANINNTTLKQEVTKILGRIPFSFGEFADLLIEINSPNLALPQRFDATLNCPFDAIDKSDNNAVVGSCDAETSDCSMSVESLAEIAGGCRSKADVGANFVLPEGTFNSITAVVQSDIYYKGFAFAVAGYAQINAKFGIRFRAPGVDKTVFAKEVHAVAPLIWFRYTHGEIDNFIAQSTFSGSFNGGTNLKVQAHTEVFALSLPLMTLTEMDANNSQFDSIRISGSN